MANSRIFLQLFGLTLLIASGLAIKCYNCESTLHPECAEITSSTKLQAELCTPSMAAIQSANWLRELINLVIHHGSFSAQSQSDGMVCQKIVGKIGDNITTIRTCQLDAANTNQCDVAKQKLKERQYQNAEIVSCDICTTDNCNSASRLSSLIGISITSILFLLRHLNYLI